ncbi:DUF72 domain-containing protein [Mucilaginibacter endophyticus]|uniref:DUF72 domain-containing protein n=1 Tax=Mucilaginibacter endophyticus TaxID=2675003 RepID=UPI000E0CECDB|nr:DUF72 domain-containing protein [Mucilaginibacter endophyticus]
MKWHIGCSGFHYKHWKGSFYPHDLPQKRWFEFYAKQFKTLELNVTFYRFPKLSVLQDWYAKAPDDFRFSVKAPKAITHFKQFHGTADMLTDFYGTIRKGLQNKLGPVLFQLPPRFHYDEARLSRVLSQLDPAFDNVLEFRHPGWWRSEVYERLRQSGISFCGMSYPGLPDKIVITGRIAYYRFHGVPNLYRSGYSEEDLSNFKNRLNNNPKPDEIWCYFNNDAEVAAIPDAKALMNLSESYL